MFRGTGFIQDKPTRIHVKQFNLKNGSKPKTVSWENISNNKPPTSPTLPKLNSCDYEPIDHESYYEYNYPDHNYSNEYINPHIDNTHQNID